VDGHYLDPLASEKGRRCPRMERYPRCGAGSVLKLEREGGEKLDFTRARPIAGRLRFINSINVYRDEKS
jgi:hypothetical protein